MKKIVIFALAVLFCSAVLAQTRVTGTVISSEDGTAVSFATIVVKGSTNLITNTDVDGNFMFPNIPGSAVLVISSIGFTTQEVEVNNRSVVNVSLSPDARALEELMVVAYGTVKKSNYSGSAGVMRAEKLQDIPVTGFEQVLSGNVAGVQISNSSGLPGAFPQIRIRGVGSMNAGNDPLYVIDGIPAISGDWSVSGTETSSMNFLNPSDIESVTILKDAAAAALYGSRASNGVVLITTKKGRAGRTQISFKNSIGFSNFAFNNLPLTTEAETEMLHREAWSNYANDYPEVWNTATYNFSKDNYVNSMVEYYYPSKRPGYGYVNWEKELFRTGVNRTHELSIAGGSETTRFFMSGAYNKNESVSTTRFMDRISGTLNVDHKVNKWVNAGINIQMSYTNQVGNQESSWWDNPWFGVKTIVTDRWPAYNPDGTLWKGWPITNSAGEVVGYNSYFSNTSQYRNPITNRENQITSSAQSRLIAKPYLEAELFDGLKVKSIFSFDGLYLFDKFGWLPEHANGQAYGDGFYLESEQTVVKLVSSSTLNYNKTFGDHSIGAMVGWEAEDTRNHYSEIDVADLYSTSVLSTTLASTLSEAYGSWGQNTLLSFISSLNYDYKSKYYITATYRRDGSSRLAANRRWGDFWSVSGSWRMINESFMQEISWLNDLRIRASYGVSGTLPSRWYYHKSFYSAGTDERYGDDGGFRISEAFNTNLTWEKNHSFNIALETRIFDRARLSIDYYTKKTTDLLMSATTAQISGIGSILRNVGNMMNKGIEIDLNVDIIKSKDLNWSVGFNWTKNKNEITKMSFKGERLQSSPFMRQEGYSYYQYYTREYLGVDSQTGQPMFASNTPIAWDEYGRPTQFDKTVVYDARDASNILLEGITGDPKGYGGISTNFSYKGFNLSMLFNYTYGHYVFDQGQDEIQVDGGTGFWNNISREQLKRWQKPGDITDVPRRMPYVYAGVYNSSRMCLKGDYIRLKNLTLSYNLPQKWVTKAGLESLRLYTSGTNLLTFTGLYFDPEAPFYGGYFDWNTPPVKTITFGIEITL